VNALDITVIGKPEPWLIEAAASIGLDLAMLTHEVTNYFVNHGIKRHGNAETEKAQGQLPVTLADIERILEIVKAPDCAVIGIKRHDETLIAYSKKFEDWTVIYYEEVLNSKKNKALRSRTMFKKMGAVNADKFLKIVTANVHTDAASAKMVVGAGGRPGGET
jgi:hypothetical protein